MLYFYCLTDTPTGTFNMINFAGETNSTRTLTANFNCVPMISVSHNIPIVMTIETKNWIPLPIFDSNDVTLATSLEIESTFYENIQIFGFIENYYTQMLLSANDIINIKLSGYSLYQGLQNHIDVVEYYDYLTASKNFYSSLDRTILFIRSEKCYDDSCSNTYFNSHWISVIDEIENFLKPTKESSWILLEKFAHYYNRKEIVDGFGEIFNLWNDIFAILYQQKFQTKNNLSKFSFNSVSNYRKGFPFIKWSYEEKLNLFMCFFGYDGTDTLLREFRIRYNNNFNNIIPIILEIFLDIYDINLLPFLQKIIPFKNYNIPLLSPDLELRVLSGHSVMPAVDFNINPTQLQIRSKERDLRKISPLMLLKKARNIYFLVKFAIESPIDLTGRCLYLNNKCHQIEGNSIKLKLLNNVYSIYIAEEVDNNLYVSELTYHTISKNMLIQVKIDKIEENKIFLPFVHYNFDAQGISDIVFLRMFINYKDMTLAIKQLTDQIHDYFKDDLYFSLSLERNGSLIFKYEFFGASSQNKQSLINVVHKFKINDKINIYHREPHRLQINIPDYNNESPTNIFVFTNVGLHNVADGNGFKFISADIKRIDKFMKNYSVDLSYNPLFQFYFAYYIRMLLSNNLKSYIPNHWFLESNNINVI